VQRIRGIGLVAMPGGTDTTDVNDELEAWVKL
jgi:hypothetical protein